ncbi:MAG: short-chain dehydrogenase [Myxococcaceae bacterium]|nr:short-chain dehydrogenase [Myxococcaceae bacterium]
MHHVSELGRGPRFLPSQVFLVTGASSGIGKSIARRLVDSGATVLACGRDAKRLEEGQQTPSGGGRSIPVPRDLSVDLEGLSSWVQQLALRFGPLSGIVHSAGILGTSPLRVLSRAFVERVMELNFFAFLMLAKGLVQDGARHSEGASLVLLSSVASLRGLSSSLAYSASKGAANAAVLALSAELAEQGIRCNAILPGVVQTAMTDDVAPEQIAYLLEQQFVPGRIQAEDIAGLCTLLLSDWGRFITGQLIAVDAGSGAVGGPRPYT